LKYWDDAFVIAKADVDNRRNDAPYMFHGQTLIDKEAEWDARLEKAKADSLENLRTVILSADPLRQLMLLRVPKNFLVDADVQWSREFAETKTNPSDKFEGEAAAKYLEDLRKRTDASR
jgi:hypothetical protein